MKTGMNIRDALQLKHHDVTLASGLEVRLRRPSTLDLITAMEQSKSEPNTFGAWLVFNHLMDGYGKAFANIQEVLNCDVVLVEEIAKEIEKLYGEGKN
jgi:hypothetical protein